MSGADVIIAGGVAGRGPLSQRGDVGGGKGSDVCCGRPSMMALTVFRLPEEIAGTSRMTFAVFLHELRSLGMVFRHRCHRVR